MSQRRRNQLELGSVTLMEIEQMNFLYDEINTN